MDSGKIKNKSYVPLAETPGMLRELADAIENNRIAIPSHELTINEVDGLKLSIEYNRYYTHSKVKVTVFTGSTVKPDDDSLPRYRDLKKSMNYAFKMMRKSWKTDHYLILNWLMDFTGNVL